MDKTLLETFISKYNFVGDDDKIESVVWEVKDKKLVTVFGDVTRSFFGSVELNNFSEIENGAKMPIFVTSKLKSLLGVLEDDVKIKTSKTQDRAKKDKYVSLNLSDGDTSVKFFLSEIGIIPEPQEINEDADLSGSDLKIPLTKDLMELFIKSRNSLGKEYKSFTVFADNSTCYIMIGYSDISRTNVKMKVEPEFVSSSIDHMSFKADFLKEVFSANKNVEDGYLLVYKDGLLVIHFEDGDFSVNYYLLQTKTNE